MNFSRNLLGLMALSLGLIESCAGSVKHDPSAGPVAGSGGGAGTGVGADTGGESAGATAVAGAATASQRPSTAANGVPIPSLDDAEAEPCGALDVHLESCSDSDCKPLICDCGSRTITFDGCCFVNTRLTHLSCPAACTASDPVLSAAICQSWGICSTDADCKAQQKCVRSRGESHGECSGGLDGSLCYQDADCFNSKCVVGSDGGGVCSTGSSGNSRCNVDSDCRSPSRCVLDASTFAGWCSDGSDDAPCLADTDCQSPAVCLSFGVCSQRGTGSICRTYSDCGSGICAQNKCQTGEAGAVCTDARDCKLKYCVLDLCTNGAPGDKCYSNTDCAGACVMINPPGTCTNGKLGEPCDERASPTQCTAGLHCEARQAGISVCVALGAVGAPCNADSDCQSQKCGAAPFAPGGICSEGKLGQNCRPDVASSCDPGLHCFSDGIAGLCTAGNLGDPCAQATDCESGTCGAAVDVTQAQHAACFGQPDLTPCAQGGACFANTCFPRTCAAAAN